MKGFTMGHAAFLGLGIGLVVGGWSALARADDIAARFGGFSVGVNAGAAWGRSNYSTDPNCPPDGIDAIFCNAAPDPSLINGAAVAASGTRTLRTSGLMGGVQAGYNRQAGRIVYGGEADFAGLRVNKTATASGAFPFPFLGTGYSVTSKTTVNWMSTVRARVGVTVTPQILLYVTGGAAFAEIRFSSAYADNAIDATLPGGSGFASTNAVKAG